MDMEITRPQGREVSTCEPGSSSPEHSGLESDSTRRPGVLLRRTWLSSVGDVSRSGPTAPSVGKPFRKFHGVGTDRALRSRISECQGQMVVKAPGKNLVMEEVIILKRGENLNSKTQEIDCLPSQDSKPSDPQSSNDHLPPAIPKSSDDSPLRRNRRRPKVSESSQPVLDRHPSADIRPAECAQPPTSEAEAASDIGLLLRAADRLGPEPERVPLPYAGSLFLSSPSPRCLPLPSSSLKKKMVNTTDLTTKGLRLIDCSRIAASRLKCLSLETLPRGSRSLNSPDANSPKERLLKVCAANHWRSPTFWCCREEGENHRKKFAYKVTVEVKGTSSTIIESFGDSMPSKKAAQHHAAEGALWCLRKMSLPMM